VAGQGKFEILAQFKNYPFFAIEYLMDEHNSINPHHLTKKIHFILLLLILTALLPARGLGQLTIEQQKFVDTILPLIKQVNNEISVQRAGIYDLYQKYRTLQEITPAESFLIYKYLKFYRCDVPEDFADFNVHDKNFINLLKKVDIIPTKLVLAQAALESNWGKSRFALDGYNFFGIRCMSSGCGYRPKAAGSKNFMVKAYGSPLDGIRDYARLLNSSRYYKELRNYRITNRLNAEMPDPIEMAKGLENFSIKRKAYVESLIYIMNHNFQYF
jgi:Bax protein